MMAPPQPVITGLEGALREYVSKKFNSVDAIYWAIDRKEDATLLLEVVKSALDNRNVKKYEPYLSAWGVIVDSLASRKVGRHNSHHVQALISQGPLNERVVQEIVDLVRPALTLARRYNLIERKKLTPGKDGPKSVAEILAINFDGAELVSWDELTNRSVLPIEFATDVMVALDGELRRLLRWAKRSGVMGPDWGRLSTSINRVIWASKKRKPEDPDAYNHGLAPIVRLLFEVTSDVFQRDCVAAWEVVQGWKYRAEPIWSRLWSAAALEHPNHICAEAVGRFLQSIDDHKFWLSHQFPEIAELRSQQWCRLQQESRVAIEDRILALPPGDILRTSSPSSVEGHRFHLAALDLQRISNAGGALSPKAMAWLREYKIENADILENANVDDLYSEGVVIRSAPEGNPDKFVDLNGESFVFAIEEQLSEDGFFRSNDAEAAVRARLDELISYFLDNSEAIEGYPRVWNEILRSLRPDPNGGAALLDRAAQIANRISTKDINLLQRDLDALVRWVDLWSTHLPENSAIGIVWDRVWPLAVHATNELATEDGLSNFDGLNSPVGWLISAYFRWLPSTRQERRPFDDESRRGRRDRIFHAEGAAGVHGRYRLIEQIPYLHQADPSWVRQNLVPLLRETEDSLPYWEALSRRAPPAAIVRRIARPAMAVVTSDWTPEELAGALADLLVNRALRSAVYNQLAVVQNHELQQMLRVGPLEARRRTAQQFTMFQKEAAVEGKLSRTREDLFENAIRPSFIEIWPPDQSLVTSRSAETLAPLPAYCGSAFVTAVALVRPFIVPFDCWALYDFGLDERDLPRILALPGGENALLDLLDRAVGNVVPYDLPVVLDAMKMGRGAVVDDARFARLQTQTVRFT